MRIGIAIVAAAALCAIALPADAQTRTKRVVTNRDHTVVVMRDEDGRKRTRIIVQRRSYLDAGVNVKPGDRKYTDYVISPTSSVNPAIDNTAFNFGNSNRPGPFDLPGKNNPMQW